MTDVATVIARRLAAAGVRFAFGIPGGEVLVMIDALRAAGLRVELARHENAAGFMAEGVHHATGAPGVLIATVGPGAANAANAVANALQDQIPLIVLTGCVSARDGASYTHQVIDQQALFRPICKASFRVEPGAAGVLIDKAIRIATSGRPGPVHLDLPTDVQEAEEGEGPFPVAPALARSAPAPGPELERARAWLAEAARPLVIAGVDLIGDRGAVRAFCERYGAPLITSYKAKGVLPESHPLSLGGAGLSPRVDAELAPLLERSDCIVLAGYDPIEMRIGWRGRIGPEMRSIEISRAPASHHMHLAAIEFVADPAAGLEALSTAPPRTERVWAGEDFDGLRARLLESAGGSEAWGPAAAMLEAREAAPEGVIATADSGAHRILLSQIWRCDEPRALLQSTAFCTMGCALPLAIGRKLAEPARPVIGFMGDGGIEMVLGELATARDLRTPIVIVAFVDGQLGLIEKKQREKQLPSLAVEIGPTDFVRVAEAMGGRGVVARDRATMRAAVSEAFAADRFTIIAAEIGPRAYEGRI